MFATRDKADLGHAEVLRDSTAIDNTDQCEWWTSQGALGICCDGVGKGSPPEQTLAMLTHLNILPQKSCGQHTEKTSFSTKGNRSVLLAGGLKHSGLISCPNYHLDVYLLFNGM